MTVMQEMRFPCEYRLQRLFRIDVAYKDGVVVTEIEPIIFSEPTCGSGLPQIHTPHGVGFRENGDRLA